MGQPFCNVEGILDRLAQAIRLNLTLGVASQCGNQKANHTIQSPRLFPTMTARQSATHGATSPCRGSSRTNTPWPRTDTPQQAAGVTRHIVFPFIRWAHDHLDWSRATAIGEITRVSLQNIPRTPTRPRRTAHQPHPAPDSMNIKTPRITGPIRAT